MPAGFTPSPSFKSLWFRRLLWKMLPSRIFHGLYLGAGLPRYGRAVRSIWGADLLYLATEGWKVLWKQREGSIFHRNLPKINGLEGGEGVKDAADSWWYRTQRHGVTELFFPLVCGEAANSVSSPVLFPTNSYETLCLCVSVSLCSFQLRQSQSYAAKRQSYSAHFWRWQCVSHAEWWWILSYRG